MNKVILILINMGKLLPRWLNPKALLFGLVFGAYNGYNAAAEYGFSVEGVVSGISRGLFEAVLLGALISWAMPSKKTEQSQVGWARRAHAEVQRSGGQRKLPTLWLV